MKKKVVHIEGFWRKENLTHIGQVKGLYLVYSSTYNEAEDVVELCDLVYIGKASNVEVACREYAQYHLLYDPQKEFVFSYSAIADDEDLELIYQLLLKKIFGKDFLLPLDTILILLGDTNFLEPIYNNYEEPESLVLAN